MDVLTLNMAKKYAKALVEAMGGDVEELERAIAQIEESMGDLGDDVSIVNLFTDNSVETCSYGSLLVHGLSLFDLKSLNAVHDSCIVWRSDLCAVLPVNLVSVVFRRIVACCDIYTCCTSKIPDRIRQLRRRAK